VPAATRIRRATVRDLPAILALERLAFQPYRQASRRSIMTSLRSSFQSVWVLDGPASLAGLLVLWHHPHRIRIYDVATDPDLRGQGLGLALMAYAQGVARKAKASLLTLEADPKEPGLVAWYERQGFRQVARLPNYYKNGNAAVRLVKTVT
jgi:[ribosomal protein S18]-alanine N-acetyltransferase